MFVALGATALYCDQYRLSILTFKKNAITLSTRWQNARIEDKAPIAWLPLR